MRKHKSKREVPAGPSLRKIDNILGAEQAETLPRLLVRFGARIRSRERTEFFRLCRRFNVQWTAHETETVRDDKGLPREVPRLLECWSGRGSMERLARFIDGTVGIDAELLLANRIGFIARGAGELSPGAARRARLNRHQRLALDYNPRHFAGLALENREAVKCREILRIVRQHEENSIQASKRLFEAESTALSIALRIPFVCGRALVRRMRRS